MRVFLRNLFLVIFLPLMSWAQLSDTGFWRHRNSKLIYTTSAQSIPSGRCSGIVTVQSANASSVPTNVTSNLTVTLSSAGTITYYSDVDCTVSISTVIITTGTNSSNFYFVDTTAGTHAVTAAATGYNSGIQNETISANPFVWTGGGGNANWNTAGNWQGGVAPGSGNIAVFNSTCVSNCSPTINASINVSGVRVDSGYSGTITQGAGNSITIGSGNWIQLAGNFAGGNSNITLDGSIILAGGNFTSTSGNFYLPGTGGGRYATIKSPTYFTHNSGTIFFGTNQYADGGITTDALNVDFYNVTLGRYSPDRTVDFIAAFNVRGTLNMNSGVGCTNLNINAYGNLLMTSYSSETVGSIINIVGTGTQTLTGAGASLPFPAINIQKTGGSLTLVGTISFYSNFTYTSGTVIPSTSTVVFGSGNYSDRSVILSSSSMHFNNVTVSMYTGRSFTVVGTSYVNGDLTFQSDPWATGGTFDLQGNLVFSTDFSGNNPQINFSGSGAQTVSVAPTAHPASGNWTVNKSGGSLTLLNDVMINSGAQSLTLTAGSINMNGKNLTIGNSLSLNSNTITKNAGTLIVNGVTAGTGSLYGGTVNP